MSRARAAAPLSPHPPSLCISYSTFRAVVWWRVSETPHPFFFSVCVKLVLVAVPAGMAVHHVMVGVSVICLECLAATPWGPRQQSVWPFVTSASMAIGIYWTQLTSEWRDEGLLPRHPPPPTRCSCGGVSASFLLPLHSSTLPCGFSSCTLGVGFVIVGVSKCGRSLLVACLLLACCLLVACLLAAGFSPARRCKSA